MIVNIINRRGGAILKRKVESSLGHIQFWGRQDTPRCTNPVGNWKDKSGALERSIQTQILESLQRDDN